ncbi:MAG: hypothetical protein R3300_14360, partial [Candidatus Promineifilaceae bacterium]|nr:hypothetical protein [Candidatus Promineifilaceae bacterium]
GSLPPLAAAEPRQLRERTTRFILDVPTDAPAGQAVPYLIVEGANALTSGGRPRSTLFLRPVKVLSSRPAAELNTKGLQGRATAITLADDTLVNHLQWATARPLTQNYNVSLRLVDAEGIERAHFDAQPGYGYRPSSIWRPGLWEYDRLALPLPSGWDARTAAQPFTLVARLYDVSQGEPVLIRRLGQLVLEDDTLRFSAPEPAFALPNNLSPLVTTFGETLRLRGYTLSPAGERVTLTLYWEALVPPDLDLFHFVHLVDPTSGETVIQHDSMPQYNTYPTSQWVAGQIVPDQLTLDLDDVAAGDYQLFVGLYHRQGESFPRLAVRDAANQPVKDDRVQLPTTVTVAP